VKRRAAVYNASRISGVVILVVLGRIVAEVDGAVVRQAAGSNMGSVICFISIKLKLTIAKYEIMLSGPEMALG